MERFSHINRTFYREKFILSFSIIDEKQYNTILSVWISTEVKQPKMITRVYLWKCVLKHNCHSFLLSSPPLSYTKCKGRHYFHEKKLYLSVSVISQKLPIGFLWNLYCRCISDAGWLSSNLGPIQKTGLPEIHKNLHFWLLL